MNIFNLDKIRDFKTSMTYNSDIANENTFKYTSNSNFNSFTVRALEGQESEFKKQFTFEAGDIITLECFVNCREGAYPYLKLITYDNSSNNKIEEMTSVLANNSSPNFNRNTWKKISIKRKLNYLNGNRNIGELVLGVGVDSASYFMFKDLKIKIERKNKRYDDSMCYFLECNDGVWTLQNKENNTLNKLNDITLSVETDLKLQLNDIKTKQQKLDFPLINVITGSWNMGVYKYNLVLRETNFDYIRFEIYNLQGELISPATVHDNIRFLLDFKI